MKTNVKGISLIILVISIVVLAIFGGVVLVTIDNNNLINHANNTANLDKINSIKEALNLSYNKLKIQYMNDSSLITEEAIKSNALKYGIEESDLNNYIMRIIDDVVYLGDTQHTVTNNDFINSPFKTLVSYKIYGNSVQNGSPSPGTPIEIQSVGDKTKNLLNIDEGLNNHFTTDGNGVYTITKTDSGRFSADISINLEAGKTYVMSYELIDTNSTYGTPLQISYNGGNQGINSSKYYKKFTLTTDVTSIRIYQEGKMPVGTYTTFRNLQIEESTNPTSYEPYGKYKIPIKVSGKNILNPNYWSVANTANGLTVQYLEQEDVFVLNGTNATTADYYRYYFNLPVENGSNYTLSVKYVSGNINKPPTSQYAVVYIGANDSINTHINYISTSLTNTDTYITGICNYNYITGMWFYISAGVTFDNYKIKIQLEKNTEATEYEPYNKLTNTYNIYLDEPLRKIEEYADYIDFENKRIVRQVNKIDLKDYTWYSNNQTPAIYYINQVVPAPITSTSRYAISNILPATYIGSENSNVGVNAYTSGIIRVRPDLAVYDTLDKWVDYVNDNESYLLYPTADRIEKVELPKIDITSGTTIITIDTEISPSKTVLEYLYK